MNIHKDLIIINEYAFYYLVECPPCPIHCPPNRMEVDDHGCPTCVCDPVDDPCAVTNCCV